MQQEIVRTWMTPNPTTVSPTATLDEAHQLMKALHVRHLPVVADQRLIGLISKTDVYQAKLTVAASEAKEETADAQVFDKKVFGLHDQQDIRAAVTATGKRDFVLVGLETDVCVAHSALGLQGAGYRVAVIDDATASPPPDHERGLARIAAAGIMRTSVKGVYYEWVRDLATHARVKAQLNAPLPAGLTL